MNKVQEILIHLSNNFVVMCQNVEWKESYLADECYSYIISAIEELNQIVGPIDLNSSYLQAKQRFEDAIDDYWRENHKTVCPVCHRNSFIVTRKSPWSYEAKRFEEPLIHYWSTGKCSYTNCRHTEMFGPFNRPPVYFELAFPQLDDYL